MPLMDNTQPLYELQVECYEFIDDGGWPPLVRARLVDADGRTWHFFDKTPMFFADDEPTGSTPMPVMGSVRCEVLRTEVDGKGHEVIVVRTEAEATEDDRCEFSRVARTDRRPVERSVTLAPWPGERSA